MPFIKLQFRPGINRDQTNLTGKGGYWDCDKVRFYSGYPQKLGGWAKYTINTLAGTCRQMWGWITTFTDNFLALGTNEKVYIEAGGNLFDITPLRATTAAGDVTFTATDGSSEVVVTDAAHGVAIGDYVTFSGAVSLGGNITATVLNQNYRVYDLIDSANYTIIAKNPLNGTPVTADALDVGNGGAAVVGAYEIQIGNPGGTFGYGWGSGTWGRGTWGSGTDTPIVLPQRDWWFDNFDNDLVMNIRNGPIYYWERGTLTDPSVSLNTRASLLSSFIGANEVPVKVMQALVSQNDKHLLAFGAVPFGSVDPDDFDPLLIRWATQDNPFEWEPLATNSAGFIRVSRGSRIVRAVATRQEILVWTESHLFALQYLGTTDVFGLQEYADNISIISSRCMATANNVTYWMGTDKFYAYSGRVDTLPCTVRAYVFEDLNYSQLDQIICGTNEAFNEIWWFYPSGGSTINNRYVVFNHLEKVWYFGNIVRTAWLDSPLRQYPQAVITDLNTQVGTIYNQEFGNNDDTLPMQSFIQSNDVDLAEGDQFLLTKRIIPDVSFLGSETLEPEITMAIRSRNFPGSPLQAPNDDTARVIETAVDSFTQQIFIRTRARQLAFRVSSNQLGVQWTLGSPRVDARSDGQR